MENSTPAIPRGFRFTVFSAREAGSGESRTVLAERTEWCSSGLGRNREKFIPLPILWHGSRDLLQSF